MRKNSYAIEGGAFGDEGKGKVVDYLANKLKKDFETLVVYRYNGGANAGHTVVLNEQKIVLHQIPSGALIPKSISILGKGMVLHPADLISEIESIEKISQGKMPGKLILDEMAVLALDTHRALENVLKKWQTGSAGATGRGIGPAYADVLFRHPVRLRDLTSPDWQKRLSQHYDLYHAIISGLKGKLESTEVANLQTNLRKVGRRSEFIKKLSDNRKVLIKLTRDVSTELSNLWRNSEVPFIFEGAQGVGLDPKWGVYPDVTSSEVTFSGILFSSEGIIDPNEIETKAATYKATYMSSVGTRKLPSVMDSGLAAKIRDEANEYGATTGRPRDIYNLDVPALYFFAKVSGATHFILTHLDICYPQSPVKVCVGYKKAGKEIDYRPDQEFLNSVKPEYLSLPSWDGKAIRNLRDAAMLPKEAKRFLKFFAWATDLLPFMATTGPDRNAVIDLL